MVFLLSLKILKRDYAELLESKREGLLERTNNQINTKELEVF
jgi:hypothetical protein